MREYFLKTKRLGFSIWHSDDIKYANSLWGDENITKFIVENGKMSVEEVQNRLDREIDMYRQHNIQYWPVFTPNERTYRLLRCATLQYSR